MSKKKKEEKEVKVYLFNGSVLRGKIVSPDIQVRKGLITTIVIKTSDLKEVKKSTFGFSRKNAAVKLIDGSVFKGRLVGNIEIKCTDNEVVKICCKEIFAIKTKKGEKNG